MNDIKVRKFINKLILNDHLNRNLINIINKYDQSKQYNKWKLKKDKCRFQDCINGSCETLLCRDRKYIIQLKDDEVCRNRNFHICYNIETMSGTRLKCLDCYSVF